MSKLTGFFVLNDFLVSDCTDFPHQQLAVKFGELIFECCYEYIVGIPVSIANGVRLNQEGKASIGVAKGV